MCEGLVSAAQPHSKDNSAVGWGGSQVIFWLPPVETTHAPGVVGWWKDWEWGTRGRKKEGIYTWKTRVALSLTKPQVFKKKKGAVNICSLEQNS